MPPGMLRPASWRRPALRRQPSDILWRPSWPAVFGMFTSNLPVTLAAYARSVFHSGPGGYGLLSAICCRRIVVARWSAPAGPAPACARLIAFGAVLAVIENALSRRARQVIYCVFLLPDRRVHAAPADHANPPCRWPRRRNFPRPGHGCILTRPIRRPRGPRRPACSACDDQQPRTRTGMLLAGAVPGDHATALIAAKCSSMSAARRVRTPRRWSHLAQACTTVRRQKSSYLRTGRGVTIRPARMRRLPIGSTNTQSRISAKIDIRQPYRG